mgnify:CR=1 FL=1
MNFYYEIKLNFSDNELYKFYEWSENDKLDLIKKIPIIKVKTALFKEIYNNNFEISEDLFNYISGKTIVKDNLNIENACIFCDTKNCVAIEFDKNRKSIARSTLLLEDENNICEVSFSIKMKDIEIKKIDKLNYSHEFRQETKIKNVITKEILELYKNKDKNKLEYLYYEWFNEKETNLDIILKKMLQDIKKELKSIHCEIYKIIKMSYKYSV